MTEREKIAETIVQIRGYTVLQAAQIADTLIAAGIGDVKEAKRKAFAYNREITHLDGILKGAERRAEVAEKEFKKAERRAEIAEKALLLLCDKTMSDISVMVFPSTKTQVQNKQELYDYYVRQAEKELAEEKKDAN